MPRSYTGLVAQRLLQEQQGGLLPGQVIGLTNEAPTNVQGGLYDAFTGEPVDVPLQVMGSGGDGGSRIMVLHTDVESMTWGAGNTFTLRRGRRYLVPTDLYQWLESKGLVV